MIVNTNRTINVVLEEEITYSTLTINPTPSDSTVTLTADGYTQEGNSITVANGTLVNYSISKANYLTESDSIKIVVNQNKDIELTQRYNVGDVLFESSEPGIYDLSLDCAVNVNVILVGGGSGYVKITVID